MIRISKISEKGNVRSNNEDRVGYFINDHAYLGVLCDGMGGHKNGDYAASIAINVLSWDFMNAFKSIEYPDVREFIFNSISNIKNEMKKVIFEQPDKKNMGSTIVAFIYLKELKKIILFYSGDSRCYIYKQKGEFIQATKDHNLLNRWIDEGIEEKNFVDNYHYHRYLTSALGAELDTKVDIISLDYDPENPITKILLTSDGMHEFLNNDEMYFVVSNQDWETETKLNKLVQSALINESNDNISAVLMEIDYE